MESIRCLLFSIFVSACYCNYVITPLGKIKGSTDTSFKGRKYSAFEGIPFAKPPLGDRRFKEPEPVEPWRGTWEANFPTACIQAVFYNMSFAQKTSEDCLHINVYVPRDTPNPEEKLDTIVYIHGGAYMYGAGHTFFDEKYLMDHDIVLVSFNYRLGIFGFLSTEDDVVPGNNGLKDQVLALKWVQQNIRSFGGNPDSVTLYGISAGAASVHLHYLSTLSQGLFHRGFAQSGVALNPWSLQKEPLNKAKILADAVGCPTSPSIELIQCLRQRPDHHLVIKTSLFYGYKFLPLAPFGPVVEKGSNPFLKADPYYLLVRGEVHDLPWIASNTDQEGQFFNEFLGDVGDKWEDLAPFIADYNYTLPKSQWKNAAKKIKEYYLGQEEINKQNIATLGDMLGDRLFLVGAETAVREQAKTTNSPVYYYRFGYPGDDGLKIVPHGGDAKYFLGNLLIKKPLSANELKMMDVMLNILVSFAKTGKPTIKEVNWERTRHDELTYLHINGFEPDDIRLKSVEELTPRTFWNSLGIQENENIVASEN